MKIVNFFYWLLGVVAFTSVLCVLFGFPVVVALTFVAVLSCFRHPQTVLKTVVSNPLIGHSRKSMGNATFTTWKGIDVLKQKPSSVANPNSDKQKMYRSALVQLVEIFRQIPSEVRAGFKKSAVKQSEWNAFFSVNQKNAFNFTAPPNAVLVPASVLISRGTISKTVISTVTADRSNNTVVITFPAGVTDPGQSATDKPLAVAYNITNNDWYGEIPSVVRSAGTASIAMPAAWATADTLRVYLGFYNPLSGESADSDNVAATIVA